MQIRAMTAEALYLRASEIVEDEIDPDLEETLVETDWTGEMERAQVDGVVAMLRLTLT